MAVYNVAPAISTGDNKTAHQRERRHTPKIGITRICWPTDDCAVHCVLAPWKPRIKLEPPRATNGDVATTDVLDMQQD